MTVATDWTDTFARAGGAPAGRGDPYPGATVGGDTDALACTNTHNPAAELIDYLDGYALTQGAVGAPMVLLPWMQRFIRGAFAPDVELAGLSIARGAAKTTLVSALGAAAVDPDGPLMRPRAETIAVAASFAGARVLFESTIAFLRQRHDLENARRWRVQDSANAASVEFRPTGARLRCIGSDPSKAHGLAPGGIGVLADEPAQWQGGGARLYHAVRTALGKIPGARVLAFGTRPASTSHWFAQALERDADYAQVHAARPDDPPFQRRTWERANPSLRAPTFAPLLQHYRTEAAKVRANPDLRPAWDALQLNLGTADTTRAQLLDAATYERAVALGPAATEGPVAFGVDAGATEAMSAVAAYWPATGALQVLAAFPETPALTARGTRDGVGRLYADMARRGELLQLGRHTSDLSALLAEACARWGVPAALAADRFRAGELREAIDRAGVMPDAVIWRGQGFRDGAEDVRAFRRAVADERVQPGESLLLTSALREAVVLVDASANAKLAKGAEAGRRFRARDDAAAAAILAVATGQRLDLGAPTFRYAWAG